jgi:hypothetical protein
MLELFIRSKYYLICFPKVPQPQYLYTEVKTIYHLEEFYGNFFSVCHRKTLSFFFMAIFIDNENGCEHTLVYNLLTLHYVTDNWIHYLLTVHTFESYLEY